ncbi:MAG: ABC transporter ATP-binding protein [Flavipsychrobacter sp.]
MLEGDKILDVEQLSISFGDKDVFVAVNDLSFSLEKGKTLAIVGESGSGKSLSALSIIGLLPKEAHVTGTATLCIAGADYVLMGKEHKKGVRGKLIGMVFQEPMSALNPVMKIGKQLKESITIHQQLNNNEAKTLAVEWLGKVKLPNPSGIYDRYPHELSGGQKQRVMIAMAMCNNPSLLIADEPTTALDVTVQQEVVLLMKELQREHNTAMIFITHDLNLAAKTADSLLVMYKGDVVEHGAIKAVLEQPQHKYTKALLACRPSPDQKGKQLPVVADFLNDTLPKDRAYKVTATKDSILEVDELKVYFEQKKSLFSKVPNFFKAVDGVSFQIKKGEVLGLVGESGCGKSTIGKALMGLLPITDGKVLYEGKDLASLDSKGWNAMRTEMQIIFQDPFASLNPRMTIGAMLMEPMKVHHIVPTQELEDEAKRLLDMVHLPHDAMKRYPHQFSGGQKQRLGIARALALRPKLIICDEIVSALDVSVQAQILNLLKELQEKLGLSYLFISHDLNVVHYISDRVMVMQSGKIVEIGNADQVLLHPSHEYTQALVEAIP